MVWQDMRTFAGASAAHERRASSLGPWLLVMTCFLALAVNYSARAALGLMMPVWQQELGWSRSFVSGVAAAALGVLACLAPPGGRLVDRHGPRGVMVLGLAALAAGCFATAASGSRLVFALAFGGIAGIGFGLVASHVVSTAVGQRFERGRGLAVGIATSGST